MGRRRTVLKWSLASVLGLCLLAATIAMLRFRAAESAELQRGSEALMHACHNHLLLDDYLRWKQTHGGLPLSLEDTDLRDFAAQVHFGPVTYQDVQYRTLPLDGGCLINPFTRTRLRFVPLAERSPGDMTYITLPGPAAGHKVGSALLIMHGPNPLSRPASQSGPAKPAAENFPRLTTIVAEELGAIMVVVHNDSSLQPGLDTEGDDSHTEWAEWFRQHGFARICQRVNSELRPQR